jgi:hypothetical protein
LQRISAELGIALPGDVPPWLSESVVVVTGAIFSQDLAKSKSPHLGTLLIKRNQF